MSRFVCASTLAAACLVACDDPPKRAGPSFRQVTLGEFHACALDETGSVACWGAGGSSYPVGVYPHYGQATPPPFDDFVEIDAGAYHSCGLRRDGSVACWGAGREVGTCSPTHRQCGQAQPVEGPFVQISAGDYHSCALAADGTVVCWGAGQTHDVSDHDGNGAPDGCLWGFAVDCGQSQAPQEVFAQVSAGGYETCGLKTTGQALCWGEENSLDPMLRPGPFVKLSAARSVTYALRPDGSLDYWGAPDGFLVYPVDASLRFSQIDVADNEKCGVVRDRNEAVCWGAYRDSSPGIYAGAVEVAVGRLNVCVLLGDGTIQCDGSDLHGMTQPPR